MLDQQAMRQRILDVANMIVLLEGGSVTVSEVRIVDAPAFFDQSYGATLIDEDGNVILRVSVKRSVDQIADTVIHEVAHVLLGPEHIDNPDHGEDFHDVYRRLQERYFGVVMEEITRPD
jgi:hypothetical protein